MLRVEFSNLSKKFLKKCDKEIYRRIIKKIEELCKNPFPSDIIRIIGRKEKIFRIRIGDYSVLYELCTDRNLILISEIDKRSKIYD